MSEILAIVDFCLFKIVCLTKKKTQLLQVTFTAAASHFQPCMISLLAIRAYAHGFRFASRLYSQSSRPRTDWKSLKIAYEQMELMETLIEEMEKRIQDKEHLIQLLIEEKKNSLEEKRVTYHTEPTFSQVCGNLTKFSRLNFKLAS